MEREPDGSCNLGLKLSKRQADDLEELARKTGKPPEEILGTGVYLYGGLSEHVGEGGKIFLVGNRDDSLIHTLPFSRRKVLRTEDYVELKMGYYSFEELRMEFLARDSLLRRIINYFRKR